MVDPLIHGEKRYGQSQSIQLHCYSALNDSVSTAWKPVLSGNIGINMIVRTKMHSESEASKIDSFKDLRVIIRNELSELKSTPPSTGQ